MTLDHDARFDALLRTLDPAAADLDPTAQRRADALLERIVDAPSAVPLEQTSGPARSSRARVRWVAVGAAAAAFVVAAAGLPTLMSVNPAYGSWTAKPIPVTGDTRDSAVAACREAMADSGPDWTDADRNAPYRPIPMADTARTVIAEQRGQVMLVSLVSDNDSDYTCTYDVNRPKRPYSAGGGIATSGKPPAPPLHPAELRSFGGGMNVGADGGFANVAGRIGSDVRSVTIHANGVAVEASVNDGVFAAWWPVPGPFETVMIMDVRFDVTLADGQTLPDVPDGLDRGRRPGPREIGRVERGGGIGADGEVGTAGGLVGSEVAGVTVHADGRDTAAEVSNGIFRAEWPLSKGHAKHQSGDGPSPATYTLTLRDGSILRNVQPVGD